MSSPLFFVAILIPHHCQSVSCHCHPHHCHCPGMGPGCRCCHPNNACCPISASPDISQQLVASSINILVNISSLSPPMSPSSSPTPLSSSDSPYIPLHQKTFLARAKARLATADSRQAKTFAAVELLLQFCTFYVFPSPPELGIGPLLFPKFCTNKHPGFCNHNIFNLHFANESFAFGQGVN